MHDAAKHWPRVLGVAISAVVVLAVILWQTDADGADHGVVHLSVDGAASGAFTLLEVLDTFDEVSAAVQSFQADGNDRAVELPGVDGLDTVEIVIPDLSLIQIDSANGVIAIPGEANVLGIEVEVMIAIVWSDPDSRAPGTSFGIRAPDLSLDAINADWLAGVAPSFDTTWISLSSGGHALPPSSALLSAFYDEDGDPATVPSFDVGVGASYLGNLDVVSALGDQAAQAIGLNGLTVPMGGSFDQDFGAILNGDFSVPDLSLSGTLDALVDEFPDWLATRDWDFGIDYRAGVAELSVTLAGELTSDFPDDTDIAVEGTASYSGGEVQIELTGAPNWSGTFGKDWVNLDGLQLGVRFDTAGAVAASFSADLTIGDGGNTYTTTIGIELDRSALTATFDIDGSFGLGDAIDIVNENLADTRNFAHEGFGDQTLTLTHLGFSVTKDDAGTAFSVAADLTVRNGIEARLLVGLTNPANGGDPVLLMALHLDEINLAEFIGDAVDGLEGSVLGDLTMPEINLTFAQELGSTSGGDPDPEPQPAEEQQIMSEELDPTARSFYEGIYGIDIDFSFDVGGGITQQSRVDLFALGQEFVDAMGVRESNSETVVTGAWGVSFDLNGGLPIDLTSLDVSAELPGLEFALPSWMNDESTPAPSQTTPEIAFGYEDGADPTAGGTYTIEVGGTLVMDVDDSGGDESFAMRLALSINPTTSDYAVTVAGSLSDWQGPFGLDWLTLDSVSLEFSYSRSGNSSTVSAKFESTFTVERTFGLSISIDVTDGATLATFSASLVDPISLADIIGKGGLVDEAFGKSVPLDGVLEELGDLSLGCAGDSPALSVTIRAGRETSFSIGACVSLTLGDSEFTTDIFFSLTDGKGSDIDYVFGLTPRGNLSLSTIMPDLPDGVAFDLPKLSLIAANKEVKGSSTEFGTDEREFFEDSYGQESGAEFKIDISVGVNLNVILDFDVVLAPLFPAEDGAKDPEKGDQESIASFKEALWMADDPVLMTGTLPLFGSNNSAALKMTLPRMIPADPPEWFDTVNGGQLFIELSPDAIALGGEISMKLRRSDDRIGIEIQECDMGVERLTNNEDTAEEETLCFDVLTFELKFSLEKGIPPKLNLTGALRTEAPWEQPLGIEWLTVNGAALQLQIKLSATPTIGFGFQGDIVIGEKDLFGAVSIGITVIQAPPFAIPRPLGVRGVTDAGFGLLDIVAVAETVSGGHISIDSMPDISLRNLELMFALGDNPDLCLQTGFVISGDLYIDGADFDGADADPKCPFPGPDPSAPTCDELKDEGCFARVDFSLTEDGLFATGELTEFALGPVLWKDAIVDIDLPLGLTGQKFQVKGGASAGSDDCPEATPCFLDGLVDLTVANPIPGPAFDLLADVRVLDGFYAEVEAEAGLDLIQPEFEAHAVMGSSFNTEIATATRPLVEAASVSVHLIKDIWQAMNGDVEADPIDVLLALPADLIAIGEDPPDWLTTLGDGIATLQVVSGFGDGDELDGEALLDAALNGFSGPAFPGLPDGGRSPAAVCLPFGFGPGSECWVFSPSPPVTVTICAIRCTTIEVIPALPGISGVIIPPGCTLVETEVDGRCYLIPPFTTGDIPGLCDTIGIEPEPTGTECEQEDLAKQLVEPLLDGALQTIAGESDLAFTDALDTVADRLSGTGVVFALECADFRGELGELTSSGGSGVALAFGATLFDEPLSLGLEWSFSDEDGSVIDFAKGVVGSILNPAPATCSQIEHEGPVDGSDDGGSDEDGSDPVVGVAAGRTERTTSFTMQASGDVVDEGETVTLNGTFDDPGDPNSHIVRVKWADGETSKLDLVAGRTTFEVSHVYDDQASGDEPYRVVVTVEHPFAGSLSEVLEIAVENRPPESVTASVASESVLEGDDLELTGEFTDAGMGDTHSVSIDWGDGFISEAEVENQTFSATHAYFDDGLTPAPQDLYDIAVTVVDDDGGEATGEAAVIVLDGPPEIVDVVAVSQPIGVGELVQLVIEFTDPGIVDTFTTVINWGDGQVESLDVPAGKRNFTVPHQYLAANPAIRSVYSVGVTITDDDGLSDGAGTTVSFGNDAPRRLGLGIGVLAIDEGETITLHGAFTDIGVFDTHRLFVDWGDGTSDDVSVPTRQRQFAVEHTYLEDGIAAVGSEELPITALVADQFGAASEVGVTSVEVRDQETGELIETTVGVPTIVVRNAPPTIDVTRPELVAQYSDTFDASQLVAVDVAADPLTLALAWAFEGDALTSGLPEGMSADPLRCSTDDRANLTSCRAQLSGIAEVAPGRYRIELDVADDDGMSAATTLTLEVLPEEAVVEYTGPSGLSASQGVETVELSATIANAPTSENGVPDSQPGDLTKAVVSFVDLRSGETLCVIDRIDVVADDEARGTCEWEVDGGSAAARYDILVAVGGWYRTQTDVVTEFNVTSVLGDAVVAESSTDPRVPSSAGFPGWAIVLVLALGAAVAGGLLILGRGAREPGDG